MQRLSGLKRKFEKNHASVDLDSGRNIVMVRVDAEIDAKDVSNDYEIIIEYAQNGVVSDKLLFGKEFRNKSCTIECKTKIPKSCTNIYVSSNNENVRITKIDLYEEITDDGKNRYPKCYDLELDANYYLDEISIFTDNDGYYFYSVYTSMDGENFSLLFKKRTKKSCDTKTGDIFSIQGNEARFIRVFTEYHSTSPNAVIENIKFKGRKSNSKNIFCNEIRTINFEESNYNVNISKQDTISEVYNIVKRRIGKDYVNSFELSIENNPVHNDKYDYFKLESNDSKIIVKGNNGVSLAFGINYYLKYYCNVNISEVGDQINLPKILPKIDTAVFRETKSKIRYGFNYCTHSYTMSFFDEEDWQKELDYLALNGVNLVLDLVGQEEVWRRFLTKIGYSQAEIKNYIAGPTYYAWAYMSNLFGYGGPVHNSWFEKRTELARKNHLFMRKLGMKPVLQGYCGMIPPDIKDKDEEVDIIDQGTWCSFTRPSVIRTTSKSFSKYAKMFYDSQTDVYGNYSNYYAVDPFHEGGIMDNLSQRDVGKNVLNEMLKHNKDAIWVLQSWQENPKSELLLGLSDIENGHSHALVLDLYADKIPNYNDGGPGKVGHGYRKEFDKTPFIFCMLNNFGGRCGLCGHLDNLANNIPKAFNECECIQGIGITPEASQNNPLLYDFIFECVWQKNADEKLEVIDLSSWISKYSQRRSGGNFSAIKNAYEILKETVYKSKYNMIGQGAPECIINARPDFELSSASTWGNIIVSYDKNQLIKAGELMLSKYDNLKLNESYIYDLISVLQQILSNTVQYYYDDMIESYRMNNLKAFKSSSETFIEILNLMDSILSKSKYCKLSNWLQKAEKLAEGTDDFTKNLFLVDAKQIITTWGAYCQSEIGKLRDYSNRQWSGLISSLYKKRWEIFIDECISSIEKNSNFNSINYFEIEWQWVIDYSCEYNNPNTDDLKDLAIKALTISKKI